MPRPPPGARPRRALPLAPVLLVLLLLALAPAAAGALPSAAPAAAPAVGEHVRFTVDHVGRVDPGRERAVNVTVTLCSGSGGVTGAGPQEVTLRALRAPSWLTVAVQPRLHQFTPLLPGECESQRAVMRLTSTPAAPGFELAQFILDASTHSATGPGIGYEENITFLSGYHSDLAVTAPDRVTPPSGGSSTFDLSVKNEGNSLTRVRFDVETPPAGVAVTVFDGTGGIAPRGEAGDSRTFKFSIALGDSAPREAFDLRIVVHSHYYFESSIEGETEVVTLRIDPDGKEASGTLFRVPAASPLFALLALGIAVAAAGARFRR